MSRSLSAKTCGRQRIPGKINNLAAMVERSWMKQVVRSWIATSAAKIIVDNSITSSSCYGSN
jgi:hypothetical protein